MSERALLIEDHEDIAQTIMREIDWIEFDWVKDANNAAKNLGFEIIFDEEVDEKFRIREVGTDKEYKFVLSDNYLLGNITAFHLWSMMAEPMVESTASEEYKETFFKIPKIFPISSVPESLPLESLGAFKCGESILKHDQKNPLWLTQLNEKLKEID